MSKIGIMGGSFDPCHRGHINLAIDAKLQGNLDKVIFIPAGIQPFKQDKEMASGAHRVAMLKLAIKEMAEDNGIFGFQVSTWEIDRKEISYTYKTMEAIKAKEGKDTKVFFIAGTDSFITMNTWAKAEELLSTNNFIVGVRPGYKEKELEEAIAYVKNTYGTEVEKINNRKFDISSTEIRTRLAENKKIDDLVCPSVERYIKKHGLYL